MEDKEGSDWKVRQANYEGILKQMSEPTPQLLQQLQTDLPKYLSDVNPNCLRVALSICELYFASASSINYSQIARLLIDKSFITNKQANADTATTLLLRCIKFSHDSVLNYVYDELNAKSPKIVKAMITFLVNYINESGNVDAGPIIDHLNPLLEHREQSIRKEASAAINLAKGAPVKPRETVAISPQTSPHQRPKSPAHNSTNTNNTNINITNNILVEQPVAKPLAETVRRNRSPIHKRRGNASGASSIWSSFVSKPTLELLKHQKWQSVVLGFEELKKAYTEENGNPSACVYGLCTLFIGRTFTPKVMNNLLTDILFYIKEDTVNITDDTITAILHFVVDKITDKRLEGYLFEMADIVCELMTPPYVFQAFYQHLGAKNYALPARICGYFSHSIQTFGIESKLNADEVADQIKPLCTHSDPNVRKASLECVAALSIVFGENVLEGFKFLKSVQINDIKKNITALGGPKASAKSFGVTYTKKLSSPEVQPAPTTMKKSDPSPPSRKSDQSPPSDSAHRLTKKQRIPSSQKNSGSSSTSNNNANITTNTTANSTNSNSNSTNSNGANYGISPFGEFIPSRLVQAISKTANSLECRKALEELEELLGRSLEQQGPSSVKLNEFTALFGTLRTWFTDNSTPIVTSVAKVLLLCLKLVSPTDFNNIPQDFLLDTFLLINLPQKTIRTTTLNILTELNSMVPNFVENIFLPIYPKIGVDGKKAAIVFIRDLNFNMTVQPFLPFIVSCMSDKNDEFREAASPLIQRYLQLNGASDAIKKFVDTFPPAKKNALMSLLSNSPVSEASAYFIQKPTAQQKEHREQKIDSYLPLKVMNGTENASLLTEKLEHYGQNFFSTTSFASTEPAEIESVCSLFLSAADDDFESISLTLDIVFLWWAQISLLIKQPDSFDVIFNFILRLLSTLDDNKRMINEFELTLILPTVLECVGRDYNHCTDIQSLVFDLSPPEYLLPALVYILGYVTSVYAVQADFNALLDLIPRVGWGNIQTDLVKTATRLHSYLSKDPTKNPDLFHTSEAFIEFLKKNGVLSPNLEAKPISRCNLSTKISAKLKQPSIMVYQWIVDLSSQDTQITIQALKSISQQLKTEPSVFEPHLEALIVSLITSVHTYFASDPPASRLCKYIAFCLLTLFNETSLKKVIPQPFVQQLVFEMLTHLSNGINEAVLNQVLNALIVKLIDDCTMFAFIGLLAAVGEFENREQFTERWIRLALKCFEACGVRICEVKNEESICESVVLVNKMLMKNGIDQLESTQIGSKIVGVLRSYINLVFERFNDIVNSKEMKRKLGTDAEIYKLVG